MKYLIINADDFGMSEVFNEVILDLLAKKQILSTTVMVNRVTKKQDAQFAVLRSYTGSNVSVGLHVEFTSDDYKTQINSQFTLFKKLLDISPSHIDVHKVHSMMDCLPTVTEFCKKHDLPMRNSGRVSEGVISPDAEAFFGSIADFSKIESWIKTFEDNNYYEILFHPGRFDPDCKSSLNKDRARDVIHIEKLNLLLKENDIALASYKEITPKK